MAPSGEASGRGTHAPALWDEITINAA
jgi:hypothetical protein